MGRVQTKARPLLPDGCRGGKVASKRGPGPMCSRLAPPSGRSVIFSGPEEMYPQRSRTVLSTAGHLFFEHTPLLLGKAEKPRLGDSLP